MSLRVEYTNTNGANQLVQPQARQSLKYDKKTHAKRRGLLLPVVSKNLPIRDLR